MVFLGVVRRLLYCWKGGTSGSHKGKLSQQLLNEVSTSLLSFNGLLPSEFARQSRSLKDLDYWKATELRSFLLNTGIVAMKEILQPDTYIHF